MNWTILLSDPYVAAQFDNLHALIDNYQIYSIWIGDRIEKKQTTTHQPAVQLPPVLVNDDVSFSEEYRLHYGLPTYTGTNTTVPVQYWKKLNVAPNSYPSLITIELRDEPNNPSILPIAQAVASALSNGYTQYGVSPSRTFSFTVGQPYYGYFPVITPIYGSYANLDNRGAIINVLPPVDSEIQIDNCIVYQSFSPSEKIPIDLSELLELHGNRLFNGKVRIDYQSLISGHIKDVRKLPRDISITASRTRTVRYSYYRSNLSETHPTISNTLDWVTARIEVKEGEIYILPVKDPMLGTLVTDADTQAELLGITQNNRYSCKYLFREYLPELISQWDVYYPLPGAVDPPLASTWTITATGQTPPLTYSVTQILAVIPIIRVMAASNNLWGYGSKSTNKNRPAGDHPIFNFDGAALFINLQPDGTYGTYMVDSPRLIENLEKTLEIHEALDAGVYASYLDQNGQKVKRVTNIGWTLNKLAEVMGIRRKPNGKFLSLDEQARYDRTRLSNPKWKAGDYETTSWGNKGYAMRHVPTAYVNGQRQDNQYDLVTTIPQMIEALIDQIDLGQGLQHTSEIRIKVGDQVQSYANVGQLMIDLATRVIEIEALIQRSAVMQVETSNTVRELWPAIGLAVTTKSVLVKIGGKVQQIFYPGFQAGKGSIRDVISAGHVNLGILMGQLMPQKLKDSRLNPFKKK